VSIETPTNLSAKQRQLLQDLAKTFEDDAQHPSRRSFLAKLRDLLKK
jgi:DnaJ-class molecular chaperone